MLCCTRLSSCRSSSSSRVKILRRTCKAMESAKISEQESAKISEQESAKISEQESAKTSEQESAKNVGEKSAKKRGAKTKKNRNVKKLKLDIPSTSSSSGMEVDSSPPPPPPPNVEVVAEGAAQGRDEVSGSGKKPGTYLYESIDDLLASLDQIPISHTCPIHPSIVLKVITSKKETVCDTFLQCSEKGCPVFCNWNDYESYALQCRNQGHVWFTKQRIQDMKCECGMDPTLSIAKKSLKNRNRMYLRCRYGECNLFTWWDRCPFKPVQQILTPVY